MTRLLFAWLLVIAWAAAAATPAAAQSREKGPWWPHPIWGPEDQAGGSNWITPDKILEAVSLVKTGKVYELGHVYERGMPLIGKRTFAMLVPSSPTHGPFGEAEVTLADDLSAIDEASSSVVVQGARYPEFQERLTGR